jgi:hypothetical protein
MNKYRIGVKLRDTDDNSTWEIVSEWEHPHSKDIYYKLINLEDRSIQREYDEYWIKEFYEFVEEKCIEELNKWYSVVDEGEYWTDADINNMSGIRTIVTDGQRVFTFQNNIEGWGTMAKRNWKYMRIKIG